MRFELDGGFIVSGLAPLDLPVAARRNDLEVHRVSGQHGRYIFYHSQLFDAKDADSPKDLTERQHWQSKHLCWPPILRQLVLSPM
jgi:hypothetical protein